MQTSLPTKLTLRLDATLIQHAKNYAQEQDRSLSQLVADYFAHLTVKPATGQSKTPGTSSRPAVGPVTTGLRGALRQPAGDAAPVKAPKSRRDYRAHLEEKYL